MLYFPSQEGRVAACERANWHLASTIWSSWVDFGKLHAGMNLLEQSMKVNDNQGKALVLLILIIGLSSKSGEGEVHYL